MTDMALHCFCLIMCGLDMEQVVDGSFVQQFVDSDGPAQLLNAIDFYNGTGSPGMFKAKESTVP